VPNSNVHRHLQRQLRKLGLDPSTPPCPEAWTRFLAGVSKTYEDTDLERYTLEHSVNLVEKEMHALNATLEAERDRMRLIFEVAPVGMIRSEINGLITMVNPTLLSMLGYEEHQLVDSDPMAIVHPDDRAAAAAAIAAICVSADGESFTGQRRFLHRSGATIVANISWSVARDPEGLPLFTIGVIEDISERTRLEVELRHAQKLEAVGRLAAGIAHEINTPIQFIGDNTAFLQSAFSDLLRLCDTYGGVFDRLRGILPTRELAALRDAEDAADLAYVREHAGSAFSATLEGVSRVAKIVKAMKSFAHPDQPEKTFADINLALRNTLTVGFNEVKYIADVETVLDDIGPVKCHLGDLNQVFLNLLVNAAHAIADVVGEGGGKGRITIRTRAEQDAVVIAISDTGTGIPEAIRHRVFDPFFTTKEVGRGTGQGLAISRSVVEKHGGTLTFETETGKGTTFFVRLPAEPSVACARGAPATTREAAAPQGRSPERAAG